MKDGANVDGTQSIRRVVRILNALAREPEGGFRLSEISRATGLHKATAHRMLAALMDEGFVEQVADQQRYRLGIELFVLGSAVNVRFEIKSLARPSLARVCHATQDTAYLSIRRGFDAVCIDRLEGDYPIKTLTLNIGSVRPLGVGAGSMALLAFLPDREIEEVIAENASRLANYPKLTPETILRIVRETRERQFSLNDGGVIDGMSAVGVPILDVRGQLVAALSVAAISERMLPERRLSIVETLWREAKRLSHLYSSGPWN